jgi:hypothetical protein
VRFGFGVAVDGENHLRNARSTLFNYYYYVIGWAGRQSYPHTPFVTDPGYPLLDHEEREEQASRQTARQTEDLAIIFFNV